MIARYLYVRLDRGRSRSYNQEEPLCTIIAWGCLVGYRYKCSHFPTFLFYQLLWVYTYLRRGYSVYCSLTCGYKNMRVSYEFYDYCKMPTSSEHGVWSRRPACCLLLAMITATSLACIAINKDSNFDCGADLALQRENWLRIKLWQRSSR